MTAKEPKTKAESPEKGREAKRDQKTDQKPAKKQEPGKNFLQDNAVVNYIQDAAEELRRVTWPTREEALRLSVIVLVTTIISAIFLGGLDLLFQKLAALLVNS